MKPKVYIETTMFNFPFVDDAPEYTRDADAFFASIKTGKYEAYTSEYAVFELEDTQDDERRFKMLRLITSNNIHILKKNAEAERLAEMYVAEGIISPLFKTDALHIAITTVNALDCIVSLNFQHIVREWTITRVAAVNAREGYKRIGIYKPGEFLNENL